jgi:hypothetical protein
MTNNAKFKIGEIVYENEKYFKEGSSQFGKNLRRIHGEEIVKIHLIDDFVAYELSNGQIINEQFLGLEPYDK